MSRNVPTAITTAELQLVMILSSTPHIAERLLPGLQEIVDGETRATNAARNYASHLARILSTSLTLSQTATYEIKEN